MDDYDFDSQYADELDALQDFERMYIHNIYVWYYIGFILSFYLLVFNQISIGPCSGYCVQLM